MTKHNTAWDYRRTPLWMALLSALLAVAFFVVMALPYMVAKFIASRRNK